MRFGLTLAEWLPRAREVHGEQSDHQAGEERGDQQGQPGAAGGEDFHRPAGVRPALACPPVSPCGRETPSSHRWAGCRSGARRRSGCEASIAGRMSWPTGGDEQPYCRCQAGHATRQPMTPCDSRTEPDPTCPPDAVRYTIRVYTESIRPFIATSRSVARARNDRRGRDVLVPLPGPPTRPAGPGQRKSGAVLAPRSAGVRAPVDGPPRSRIAGRGGGVPAARTPGFAAWSQVGGGRARSAGIGVVLSRSARLR